MGKAFRRRKVCTRAIRNAPSAKYNNLLVGAHVIGFFILDFRKYSRNVSFAERAHRKLVSQVHSYHVGRPRHLKENVSRSSLALVLICRTTSSGLVCCEYCFLETQSDHLSRVPTLSAYPSRPSFDTYKARNLESLEGAPSSYSIAKKQVCATPEVNHCGGIMYCSHK